MKILMDADCLIKLTKAGLKDTIALVCKITIPHAVKVEVVDAGRKKGCEDAFVVEKNISDGKINVFDKIKEVRKGDDAVIHMFDQLKYDAVGTDDVRLVKRLINNGIPFILPAVILLKLFEMKHFDQARTLRMLEKLVPFISDDEYAMVYAIIGGDI